MVPVVHKSTIHPCRCLQNSKLEKGFGKACLAEVQAFEQKSSQDYRFNFRLKKQCQKDIDRLCRDVCHPDQDQVQRVQDAVSYCIDRVAQFLCLALLQVCLRSCQAVFCW